MSMAVADASEDRGAKLAAEYIERARSAAAVIADATQTIEAERSLPTNVLDAMHDAELFRLTLPRPLGGAELQPAKLAQVTEIIAAADASAAWCLGQALGCAMSAAFMEPEPARQVFGDRNAALAWGAGIVGKAVAADGGYRITGTWRFASGGHHATWLGAHCKVFEADGSPRIKPDGTQASRTAMIPRSTATILDDWYVMGLRGTRSEGYTIEDVFVEDGLMSDRETPSECRLDAPLYKVPTTAAYASMFSGVALGVARAMLDDLRELAMTKTPRGASSSLRESPVFQTKLAELEAMLGSARAYQQQVLRDFWVELEETGELTLDRRVDIRLATTNAINRATDVAETVYRLAGSTAIFEAGPFERRFRDMHAVSQQVQGRQSNFEIVGRYMLDLEVGTMFL